jgi:hypothetical protein
VYSDVDGFPSALLGVTPSTSVRTTVGWQTVSLTTPVNVTSGQTVWLAWVFENVSNIRFERTSAPASVSSSSTWSSGVPPAFGTSYDANFNFSVYCTYTTNVVADVTKPIITAFTIPATSSSLVVPVSSFSASDNKAVTGFMLTESATAPLAGNADWSAGAPVSYSFATEGTKTIYAWAKDAAGNVSTSASRQVIISPSSATLTLGSTEAFSLASSSTIRRAIPVTFNEAGQIQSISVYHNAGSGNVLLSVYSDVAGFPSALLGVTPSTAVGTTEGWQTVSLTTPVNVTSGQKVWLAWVFQNAPYIRFVSTTTPASVSSPSTWSSGVPSTFGTSYNANFKFSVYCTYTATILKDATIPQDDQTEPTLKPLYAGNNNDEVYFSIEDSTDSQESNDFSLYPNPAKSFINVDYSVMPELGTTIEIFDSNGRMLYKEPAESTSNRIGISQFPVGLYFIRSISPQKYNVKKLIVK